MTPLSEPDCKIRVLLADALAQDPRNLAHELTSDHGLAATAVVTQNAMHEALASGVFQVLLLGSFEADFQPTFAFLKILQEERTAHPQLHIIVLLELLDKKRVVEAFRSGAHGVFCRANPYRDLRKCICSVHAGQIWASSEQLSHLIDALAERPVLQDPTVSSTRSLTRREEEIAHLASTGLSNRQISQRLELSEHTVKNYLFRIFEKLGVATRVELTLYALKRPQPTVRSIRIPISSISQKTSRGQLEGNVPDQAFD